MDALPLRYYRLLTTGAVVLAVLFVVALISAATIEVNALPGDLWFNVDTMSRVAAGQRPSQDFITPIGPLFYSVYALVLRVEPVSLAAMVHTNLLVGCVAALFAWGVARRSGPREVTMLLMLLAFLTASSGRVLDTSFAEQAISFNGPYNRWSWAFAIPCAWALLADRGRDRIELVLVALAVGALFYVKMTYFLVLAGLAGCGFAIETFTCADARTTLRQAAFFFALLCAFVAAGSLIWPLRPYLADLSSVAGASDLGFRIRKAGLELIGAALVMGLSSVVYFLTRGDGDRRRWPDILRLAVLVGSGAAIMVQNQEIDESPLYYAAPLLAFTLGLAARAPREEESGPGAARGIARAFALVLLLSLVPISADVGAAVVPRLRAALKPSPPIPGFEGTPLAGLRSSGPEIERVVDGLRLLRALGPLHGSVLALTTDSPFSTVTGTAPPRGVLACWHEGRWFSRSKVPEARSVFRDAEIILVPKEDKTGRLLGQIYAQPIQTGYTRAGESLHWTALRRSPAR